MQQETSVTVLFCIWLVGILSVETSDKPRQLCDVRIWYLNIVTTGIFDIDLSDEQSNLKDNIEALVMKSTKERKVDCQILYMYNGMIKEEFNYEPLNSSPHTVIRKEPYDFTIKDNKEDQDSKRDMTESEDINVIVADKNSLEHTKGFAENEQALIENESVLHESETNGNHTNEIDDIERTQVKYGNMKDDNEVNIENLIMSTDSVSSKQHEEHEDDSFDKLEDLDASEIDETDIADGDDDTIEVNIDGENDMVEQSNKENSICTKTIPFGICKSFGCFQINRHDMHTKLEDQAAINLNKTLSPPLRINHMCELGVYCHNKCYYIVSVSYCLLGYKLSGHLDEISENVAEEAIVSTYAFNKDTEQDSAPVYDIGTDRKDTSIENINEIGQQLVQDFPEVLEKGGESMTFSQEAPKELVKFVHPESPHATVQEVQETIEQSEESYKELKHTWEKADTQRNVHEKQEFPFKQFEQMINQKTVEYSQKIQTLELMLIKLENQLLTERLNKQDHSSTITRLENLILRLENDILKMGKNYERLREETANIDKKQNKYLEIAQMPTNHYPQIPDNSVKNSKELTNQQIKINEITEIISNLSSTIHHMKTRSDYIEEQNQKLHKMIMNQTMFMYSITQNVQSLTKNNAQQKQEISELKAKLDIVLTAKTDSETSNTFYSKQMVGELLNSFKKFVSDGKIHVSANGRIDDYNEDIATNEDNDIHLKRNLPARNTEKIFAQWCLRDNSRLPVCHHQSIIQTQCIPFNHMFWINCENMKYVGDSNNKPLEPSVNDRILDQSENQNILKSEPREIPDSQVNEDDTGVYKSHSKNVPVVPGIQDETMSILNSNIHKNVEVNQISQPENQNAGCEKPNKLQEMQPNANSKSEKTDAVRDNKHQGTNADISSEMMHNHEDENEPKKSINEPVHVEDSNPDLVQQTITKTEPLPEQIKLKSASVELPSHMEETNLKLVEQREINTAQLPEETMIKPTADQQMVKNTETKPIKTHNEMDIVDESSESLDDSSIEGNIETANKNNSSSEEYKTKNNSDAHKKEVDTNEKINSTLDKIDKFSETNIQSNIPSEFKTSSTSNDMENESSIKQIETATIAKSDTAHEDTLKEIPNQEKEHAHAKSETPSEIKITADRNIENEPPANQIDKSDNKLQDAPTGSTTAQKELIQAKLENIYVYESEPKSIETEKTAIHAINEDALKNEQKENITAKNSSSKKESNTGETEKTPTNIDAQLKNVDKSEIHTSHTQQESKQTVETGKENNNSPSNDIKAQKFTNTEQKQKELNNKTTISKTETNTPHTTNPENVAPKQDSSPKNIEEKKAKPIQENQKEKTAKVERLTPINLSTDKQKEAKDCYDYYSRGTRKDGPYKVRPVGSPRAIQVYCDMKKGGWTLIHKRQDGTTNFFEDWEDYKTGFGGLYGEHWLGNDNIHLLTNQDYYTLRVDLIDWERNKRHANYDYFLVENEENAYRLHIDGYSGDAGDGLSKHDGSKFSTKDVDNDKVVKEFGGSCANRFKGAGWYYKCYASNLNGKYYRLGKIPEKRFDGITWKPWMGANYSMKMATMKIRPKSASKSVRLVD